MTSIVTIGTVSTADTASTAVTDAGTASVPGAASAVEPERPPSPPGDLFVVSVHKVRDRSGETPSGWLPYGVSHAWAPGTRRTLCGEWTNGWTVFWDRSFAAGPPATCPHCVEATLPEDSRRKLDPVASPLVRRPDTADVSPAARA